MRTIGILFLIAGCSTTNTSSATSPDGATAQACSDAGQCATSGANRDGTRIHLKYLATPDGARIVTGVHDMQRDEDCTFHLAADGAMRCLPAAATLNGYFADSNCTVPAAALNDCYVAPTYITMVVGVMCGSTAQRVGIYHAGAALNSAYRLAGLNGTTCTSTGVTPGESYYPLGTEVPATDFAMATETVEP